MLPVTSLEAYISLTTAAKADAIDRALPMPACDVRYLAPLRPCKNVFCVGRNYLAHAREGAVAQAITLDLPDVPTFFTKPPTSIAGPNDVLSFSKSVSAQLDWEAELAVIIGRRCRDLQPNEALDAIFGFTCLNDLTARDLQRAHGQWFKGKALDASCPIGPWIVPAAEIPDPQSLDITLRVNGRVKQSSNTRNMIFSIAEIIASLSAGLTLEPGDIIATGTPEGVGYARNPPEFFADGDSVEVEIAGVGVLRNIIRFY